MIHGEIMGENPSGLAAMPAAPSSGPVKIRQGANASSRNIAIVLRFTGGSRKRTKGTAMNIDQI